MWMISLIFITVGSLSFLNPLSAKDWQPEMPLNMPRYGHTAVVLDGEIYIMGGAGNNSRILNSVERFIPQAGIWDSTSVNSFNIPRQDAASIVLNQSIYLLGGFDEEGKVSKKAEVYHPSQNTWTEIEEMREERRGPIAVLLNNTICVIGGIRDNGQYVNEIEWYSVDEDKWEKAETEFDNPKFKPFGAAFGNTVFALGGIVNTPSSSSDIGTVDIDWNFNWLPGPQLQAARGNGATAVVGDSIFMIGGITINASATNMVEILNMETRQIEPGPELMMHRIGAAAATIDDTIYVIGGYDSDPNQPTASVEIYPGVITAIEPPEPIGIPQEYAIINGYPNPFNGVIQFEIHIPHRGENEIVIFDIQGRKIQMLYSGPLTAGKYTFSWSATDAFNIPVASGMYVAVLKGPDYLENLKVVYVK